jgi:hypothetical protein
MQQLEAKIVKTFTRYAFRDSFGSVVSAKVKKSKMQRPAIKDIVYGGLMEIMRNRQYYYHSGVGSSYSHFTEEGQVAVQEFISVVAAKMMEAEHAELDARAKEQVITGLKNNV